MLATPLMAAACSPVVSVAGANFPAWILCLLGGISMSFIAHQLFVRIGIDEWIEPKAIVYSCRGGRRLLVLAACLEMNATDAPMAQLSKPASRNPPWMRELGRTLNGIPVLAALTLGWFICRIHYANPRIDDAYVSANTASIAAHVSGQILQLPVKDNQHVKKGGPPVRGRFASVQARVGRGPDQAQPDWNRG